jgi:hypothetical protein
MIKESAIIIELLFVSVFVNYIISFLYRLFFIEWKRIGKMDLNKVGSGKIDL